jgi:phosphoglycerol transferase MdoB-like AlkP superfamily enzyme
LFLGSSEFLGFRRAVGDPSIVILALLATGILAWGITISLAARSISAGQRWGLAILAIGLGFIGVLLASVTIASIGHLPWWILPILVASTLSVGFLTWRVYIVFFEVPSRAQGGSV